MRKIQSERESDKDRKTRSKVKNNGTELITDHERALYSGQRSPLKLLATVFFCASKIAFTHSAKLEENKRKQKNKKTKNTITIHFTLFQRKT